MRKTHRMKTEALRNKKYDSILHRMRIQQMYNWSSRIKRIEEISSGTIWGIMAKNISEQKLKRA